MSKDQHSPLQTVSEWLQSLPEDTELPVEALAEVMSMAERFTRLSPKAMEIAGWMMGEAIAVQQAGKSLTSVPVPDLLQRMTYDLQLEEFFKGSQVDDGKPSVFVGTH